MAQPANSTPIDPLPEPPPPTTGGRRGLDLFGVLLALSVAVAVFLVARSQEERLSMERMRRIANDHQRAIHAALNDQKLVLESVRSLWGASEQVDRDEFAAFVEPLLERFPALLAVEWVPAVRPGDLADFEMRRREAGPADFRVHELAPDGPAEVPPRAVHYPIAYAAPAWAEERLGFDYASLPDQLESISRALSSGLRQTTGPHATPLGEAVYRTTLPVFDVPRVPSTLEERERSLRGYVVGTFGDLPMLQLAGSRFGNLPMSLEILDGDGGVLHSFPLEGGRSIDPTIEFPLDLGGSVWNFRYRRMFMLAGPRHTVSWVLFGFGLLLTGLFTLHVRTRRERELELASSNFELKRQARELVIAEAKSHEAQRALTTLLDNLPGMAYRCANDEDWSMQFLSDGCLALTGYAPHELRPGRLSYGKDVIAEADREQVWENVQRAIEERRPFKLIYRVITKQGEERWVWEQGQGVYGDSGELIHLEGFVTDISAQRAAEQDLRKEKQFSDNALESLPGVFYLFDSDGKYLRWNRNLETVSGHGSEEIARMQPLDFIAPEDHELVAQRIADVFEHGSTTAEAHMLTSSGERIPYFFTGQRMTLDGKLCVVGMGIDVTDRVRAEQEQQAIQRKVMETQKLESVGLLAGGIAHDFNNLLTTMIGNLRFAREQLPPTSKALEFVDLAGQAANRAGELTRQLLAYTGRASFERIPIDLSELIQETAPLLTSSIPKKVTLNLKLADQLPAVEVDPTQIRQVAMNLVLNGAEACGDHAGVVRVRTETRTVEPEQVEDLEGGTLAPGRYVSLVVEDTGAGMDEATRSRIFDPFFTTKFTGRGLGLAAVLGIVRSHGGALEVSSSPGRGSSFEVLLPASELPSRSDEDQPERDLRGTGRILVADDEDSVLRVVSQALTDCGYEVLQARNGTQAVEIFRRRASEIDLVLLDQTMPEMSGTEALRAIHALRPDVPALLSSGYDEEQATMDAFGAGLAGFLQKPYAPETLAAKVKDILTGEPFKQP